jgi:hypothetical protein
MASNAAQKQPASRAALRQRSGSSSKSPPQPAAQHARPPRRRRPRPPPLEHGSRRGVRAGAPPPSPVYPANAATSPCSSTSTATSAPTGMSLLPARRARGRAGDGERRGAPGPAGRPGGGGASAPAGGPLDGFGAAAGLASSTSSCPLLAPCLPARRPNDSGNAAIGAPAPSPWMILARYPSSCASHSMVALSVSTSASTSPGAMEAPSFLRQAAMLPCASRAAGGRPAGGPVGAAPRLGFPSHLSLGQRPPLPPRASPGWARLRHRRRQRRHQQLRVRRHCGRAGGRLGSGAACSARAVRVERAPAPPPPPGSAPQPRAGWPRGLTIRKAPRERGPCRGEPRQAPGRR